MSYHARFFFCWSVRHSEGSHSRNVMRRSFLSWKSCYGNRKPLNLVLLTVHSLPGSGAFFLSKSSLITHTSRARRNQQSIPLCSPSEIMRIYRKESRYSTQAPHTVLKTINPSQKGLIFESHFRKNAGSSFVTARRPMTGCVAVGPSVEVLE